MMSSTRPSQLPTSLGPLRHLQQTDIKSAHDSVTSTDMGDDLWNMDLSDIMKCSDTEGSRRNLDDLMGSSRHDSDRLLSPMRADRSPRRAAPMARSQTMPNKFSNSDTTSNRPRDSRREFKRSVSFDKVKVRVFERVLADNPPASSGPSLGLGWKYNEEQEVDLDSFENKAVKSPKPKLSWRRNKGSNVKKDLVMSPDRREKMAKKLGFSSKEIKENVRMVDKVLRERHLTVAEIERKKLAAKMADYDRMHTSIGSTTRN